MQTGNHSDANAPGRQQEMAAWIERNRPAALPGDPGSRFAVLLNWQRALYDAGWLGMGWPAEYGGRGGDLLDRIRFYRQLAGSRAPFPPTLIGLDVIAPTLLAHGTEEQKRRFLPPLLRGDEVWCQGFSEPEAGSDLASLRTRAIVERNGFRINGHKIWTSTVQYAGWCALLARTNPEAPKHKGISLLIVDMRSPGVLAQPITEINGGTDFGEVFFDDVVAPGDAVIGGLNDGWRIAMSTLVYERSVYTLRRGSEVRMMLDSLAAQAGRVHRRGRRLIDDPGVLRSFGRCEALVEALAAQGRRTADRLASGNHLSESSIDKLFLSKVEQSVLGLAVDLLGPYAVVEDGPGLDANWLRAYQYGRAGSVYGGSAEIQRTIIAESILGLPRG